MSSTTEAGTSPQLQLEKAALIDDEGDITSQFESALIRIFARFSTSYRQSHPDIQISGSSSSESIPRPNAADVLTEADLDAFSTITNGAALPVESKTEIKEFLDTDKDGNLTFRGFVEMYHLQSDNEQEETWKDLGKLGFDDQLKYKGGSEKKAESESTQEDRSKSEEAKRQDGVSEA